MLHHEGGHHESGESPTQLLVAEHEVILQALDAMEARLEAMGDEPTSADREFFEQAVEFLRGFADTCHHGKEGDLLFTKMAARGFPTQGGPIAVMLSEHQAGRAFIRGMAEGAAKIGTDPRAGELIDRNARGYLDLLRNHIAKENQVLFPMADRALSPEDQRELSQAFERFEAEQTGAGVHARMLTLLQSLRSGSK
jgi:hemerythrin-like domain-containing protein